MVGSVQGGGAVPIGLSRLQPVLLRQLGASLRDEPHVVGGARDAAAQLMVCPGRRTGLHLSGHGDNADHGK